MPTPRRILLLQGHPDSGASHFGHALEEAYAQGAAGAGHEIRRTDVASLEFPLLRSQSEWQHGSLPEGLREAQTAIGWAEHIVIFFPLWLGGMPALLKGFLEQVARPGFAFRGQGANPFTQKALGGRSARVVVTMGMPSLVYRWYFRAHSVKALERNILGFVGISPIRETLIGSVEAIDAGARSKWLARLSDIGARGE
jgi:putative NADPH-quinone reductase